MPYWSADTHGNQTASGNVQNYIFMCTNGIWSKWQCLSKLAGRRLIIFVIYMFITSFRSSSVYGTPLLPHYTTCVCIMCSLYTIMSYSCMICTMIIMLSPFSVSLCAHFIILCILTVMSCQVSMSVCVYLSMWCELYGLSCSLLISLCIFEFWYV